MPISTFRPAVSDLKLKNFSGVALTTSGTLRLLQPQDEFMFVSGTSDNLWRMEADGTTTEIAQPIAGNLYGFGSGLGRLNVHIQNSGFYYSDDNGDTWSSLIAAGPLFAYSMSSDGAGNLFCAGFGSGNYFHSGDNGDSWSTVTITGAGSPSAAGTANVVEWCPSLNLFVFLAGQTICTSPTGANGTWTVYNHSATIPTGSLNTQTDHDGKLYMVDTVGKMWLSEDAGVSITDISSRCWFTDDTITGGSTDTGGASMIVNNDIIYLGSNTPVLQYSDDSGQLFKPATVGSTLESLSGIDDMRVHNGEVWCILDHTLLRQFVE